MKTEDLPNVAIKFNLMDDTYSFAYTESKKTYQSQLRVILSSEASFGKYQFIPSKFDA